MGNKMCTCTEQKAADKQDLDLDLDLEGERAQLAAHTQLTPLPRDGVAARGMDNTANQEGDEVRSQLIP